MINFSTFFDILLHKSVKLLFNLSINQWPSFIRRSNEISMNKKHVPGQFMYSSHMILSIGCIIYCSVHSMLRVRTTYLMWSISFLTFLWRWQATKLTLRPSYRSEPSVWKPLILLLLSSAGVEPASPNHMAFQRWGRCMKHSQASVGKEEKKVGG